MLDAYGIARQRADAHPSYTAGSRAADCLHYCLPGVPCPHPNRDRLTLTPKP